MRSRKRGNVDRQHADAVEKVLAKAARGDQRFQVLVRGGDDADTGGDRRVAADPLELSLLQEPQELGLRGRGHVAHFVQKERAAVGLFELADAAAVGAGEGPAFVAEELALHRRLRNGPRS